MNHGAWFRKADVVDLLLTLIERCARKRSMTEFALFAVFMVKLCLIGYVEVR